MSVDEPTAAALRDLLAELLARSIELRPARFRAETIGKAAVVVLYERATSLARAIDVLLEAGLAEEADHQLRGLLEVAVVLSHAVLTERDLDQIGLALLHETSTRQRSWPDTTTPEGRATRVQLEAQREAINAEAGRRGLTIRGALNVTTLAGEIGRQDQVRRVNQHTSGFIHLAGAALAARLHDTDTGELQIAPFSTPRSIAATAETAVLNYAVAAHATAYLLHWETADEFARLRAEAEQLQAELVRAAEPEA